MAKRQRYRRTTEADQRQTLSPCSRTCRDRTECSMVTGKKDYNDDAFGFVFLGSLALTQDAIFAGSFIALSAAAAVATRSGKLPATRAVPAAVAGSSLLLAIILRQVASGQDGLVLGSSELTTTSPLPENGAWIQVGLCTVSMIYGFVMASMEEDV